MAGKPRWTWRRVARSLPAPGQVVWVWGRDFLSVTLAYYDSEGWVSATGHEALPEVAIWCALDKPPLPTYASQVR